MSLRRRLPQRIAAFTKKTFPPALCLSVLALGLVRAAAAPVVLFNGNSSVALDPASPNGISDWTVDGQDLLHQQWFWYGLGNGTMSSIETIGTPTILRPNDGTIQLTYANSQFSLDVRLLLLGGPPGSGSSDLAEQIRIMNLTGSPLDFHFMEFADVNAPDKAVLSRGLNGSFNGTLVSGQWGDLDTVFAPGANAGQLNGTMPQSTWTLNWNQTIAPGNTFLIGGDSAAIVSGIAATPEPGTASLLSLGLAGLLMRQRARRPARPRGR